MKQNFKKLGIWIEVIILHLQTMFWLRLFHFSSETFNFISAYSPTRFLQNNINHMRRSFRQWGILSDTSHSCHRLQIAPSDSCWCWLHILISTTSSVPFFTTQLSKSISLRSSCICIQKLIIVSICLTSKGVWPPTPRLYIRYGHRRCRHPRGIGPFLYNHRVL